MNNPKDGCVYFKKALAINDGGIFKNDINAKIKKYCN